MTQELTPEVASPAAPERPSVGDRLPGWLRRRLSALRPRSLRHWAAYVVLVLVALFLVFECGSTTTYSATVQVMPRTDENVIGISPYTDRLDFGDLPQGGSATLSVTLENGGPVPTRMVIVATGDIRQFIKMSDAFFLLQPGDEATVEFTAVVPGTAEPKRYSGKVYVIRTPWPPWP